MNETVNFRISRSLLFFSRRPAGRFIMEIANGESNTAGGKPLDNTPSQTNFGPANHPDWIDSAEYQEWLRLAKLPHESQAGHG
jgi:hypothetical protein